MPPKPALKKRTAVAANAPPAPRPVNQHHLQVAVHHATVLEQRKRVEVDILDAIADLIDFPTTPDADPTRPSPSDALRFCQALVPFQPADYDGLIEERNITGKCGYTLCPRPKGNAPSAARKHIVQSSKGLDIVDRKALEVWCSADCARRALFVKVQLREEPAWLRQANYGSEIELMVENADEHHRALPLRLKKEPQPAPPPPPPAPSTEEADIAAAWAARDDALADLAIERGETPGRLSKANKDLITEKIKERVARFPPVPPSLQQQQQSGEQSHMAIEGHVPRAARDAERVKNGEEEDDDQDWDRHLPG